MEPIATATIRDLLRDQFPEYAGLELQAVPVQGHNNWTYRLGEHLSLRFPQAEAYAGHVPIEWRWLPWLAERLPVPIPKPVALGEPSSTHPWPWLILKWIEGETAIRSAEVHHVRVAEALVGFLRELHGLAVAGGPKPGPVNFGRGGGLSLYDEDTRRYLEILRSEIPYRAALDLWQAALARPHVGEPVWIHGDLLPTNLLIAEGGLAGVIDFGQCAVGDPACDLVIAWNWFSGPSREAFLQLDTVDEATWLRAKAWSLWKALFLLHDPQPGRAETPAYLHGLIRTLCG